MKRTLAAVSGAMLLAFCAHASASSNVIARFEGTWRSGGSRRTANGNQFNVTQTITIRNDAAQLTLEINGQLSPGRKWNDIPSPYNTYSPVYTKWVNRSSSITVEGSNLRVRWAGARLVDWSPKSVPATALNRMSHHPAEVLLIRNGEKLIDSGEKSAATYSRVH